MPLAHLGSYVLYLAVMRLAPIDEKIENSSNQYCWLLYTVHSISTNYDTGIYLEGHSIVK